MPNRSAIVSRIKAICGPNRTISADLLSVSTFGSDTAQILTFNPLSSATCCIFFTKNDVDIPSLQHNKIFAMLFSSLLVLKCFSITLNYLLIPIIRIFRNTLKGSSHCLVLIDINESITLLITVQPA